MRPIALFGSRGLAPAILEVMLIMFSVLAALGLQSWWDGRVERDSLVDYLVSLEHELQQSSEALDKHLELTATALKEIDEIFTILADTSGAELPDSLGKSLGDAYTIYSPDLAVDAYEDIVSSGNLRLIRNRTLRAGIAKYMQAIANVSTTNQELWDTYYELQVPFLSKHLVLSDFGWESPEDMAAAAGWLRPTPKGPHSVDPAAIKTQEYWNLLYSWKAAYIDRVRAVMATKVRCDELLELLRSEIAHQRA